MRMKLPFIFAVSAMVLPAFTSAAWAGGAMDIMSVYSMAREADPLYASAKASKTAGEEKETQAKALFLPTVSLAASAARYGTDTSYNNAPAGFSLQGGSKSYNYSSLGLSLTQPVYRPQNTASANQLSLTAEQATVQLTAAEQDLITRASQAYFDLLFAADTLDFMNVYRQSIARQLTQAKRMFEVGAATITDTHDAQARDDIAVFQEIAARNDIDVKKDALKKIIGAMPENLATLDPAAPLEREDLENEDKWMAVAEQENPSVKLQRLILSVASEEAKKSDAGHYPTIDVVASYSLASSSDSSYGAGVDTATTIAGAQLTLPIYQGGGVSSKAREAAALEMKARSDLEAAIRQARFQASSAYLSVKNGLAQVKALKRAVESSEKSLESTRKGFEVGVRTAVDVLNAQQQIFSARRDHALARYNYVMSFLRLKAAAGVLDVKDVEWINGLLARD